jgi:shikimate dehydrogenase
LKQFTIFGNPVAHSKSPNMHNNAFNKFGINALYTKTKLQNKESLKSSFLDGGFVGANVTVPFKEDAFAIADEIDGVANDIGAVNTLINKNGKIVAYNSDAYGFSESIKDFKIKNALILGAGGTARAAAFGFGQKSIDCSVVNRSKGRLAFFKQHGFGVYEYSTLDKFDFDIIVNTTSAGLSGELPCSKELLVSLFANSTYSVDVVYGVKTPFISLAKKHGQIVKDGSDMLIYQGVLAFLHFTDFAFDKDLVYKYLREGLKQ